MAQKIMVRPSHLSPSADRTVQWRAAVAFIQTASECVQSYEQRLSDFSDRVSQLAETVMAHREKATRRIAELEALLEQKDREYGEVLELLERKSNEAIYLKAALKHSTQEIEAIEHAIKGSIEEISTIRSRLAD